MVPVDFTLAKELAAPVHATLQSALTGGDPFTGGAMVRGGRLKAFVAPPADRAPGSQHGDVLVGKVRVGCGKEWEKGSREDCALQVLVPKEAAKDEAKPDAKQEKTDEELEREEVRDARIRRLKTLREDKKWEAFDALASSLLAGFPAHLPLLAEIMLRWNLSGEDGEAAGAKSERCAEAIRVANVIVASIDVTALAAHYGVKHDSEDPAVQEQGKEMDRKKEALLGALLCCVERYLEMLAPASASVCAAAEGVSLSGVLPPGETALQHLKGLWGSVQQWWVAGDQGYDERMRYAQLLSQVRRHEGRPGAAGAELLKILNRNEGAPSRKVLRESESLCGQMGWDHWTAYYTDLTLKQFPSKYALI